MSIKFNADKVKVLGPKVDGGYAITFEVGEHEQEKIGDIIKIPQQTELKITIEIE